MSNPPASLPAVTPNLQGLKLQRDACRSWIRRRALSHPALVAHRLYDGVGARAVRAIFGLLNLSPRHAVARAASSPDFCAALRRADEASELFLRLGVRRAATQAIARSVLLRSARRRSARGDDSGVCAVVGACTTTYSRVTVRRALGRRPSLSCALSAAAISRPESTRSHSVSPAELARPPRALLPPNLAPRYGTDPLGGRHHPLETRWRSSRASC